MRLNAETPLHNTYSFDIARPCSQGHKHTSMNSLHRCMSHHSDMANWHTRLCLKAKINNFKQARQAMLKILKNTLNFTNMFKGISQKY